MLKTQGLRNRTKIFKTNTITLKKVKYDDNLLDYDKLYIENETIKKEYSKKSDMVVRLTYEGEEMKNAINKLTEVRVILNKYFSINMDNFT